MMIRTGNHLHKPAERLEVRAVAHYKLATTHSVILVGYQRFIRDSLVSAYEEECCSSGRAIHITLFRSSIYGCILNEESLLALSLSPDEIWGVRLGRAFLHLYYLQFCLVNLAVIIIIPLDNTVDISHLEIILPVLVFQRERKINCLPVHVSEVTGIESSNTFSI